MTFDSASIAGCKINMCFKYTDVKGNDMMVNLGTVQRVRYEKRSQEEPAVSFGRKAPQTLKGVYQIKGSLTAVELQQSIVIDILVGLNFLRVNANGSYSYNTVGGVDAIPTNTNIAWTSISISDINYNLLNTLLKGINLLLYYVEPNPSDYSQNYIYQKEIMNIIIDGESSAMGMDVLALQTEIPFTASFIRPFRKVV